MVLRAAARLLTSRRAILLESYGERNSLPMMSIEP